MQKTPQNDQILRKFGSLKFLTKPWIMQGLQNSIKKKSNIYSRFVKFKNKILKELHPNNYKSYRNLLSTLLKRDKEKYFTNFFNKNIEDIKKTWKGIKTLVSMKQKNNDTPSLITKDEKYINDPASIANSFNKLFTSVAEIAYSKIQFSNKSFRKFLSSEINDSFLITSTNKEEIYKIIKFLKSNKSCRPNSIPTKDLHILQDQISNHLATICNLSFSTGVFPAIPKTAKVIPIHKKNSKLEVSNYRPISLLSNIDKIFEKLMDSRLIEFLEGKQILYYRQFGFRKDFSTNHAILTLLESIQKVLDDGRFTCGIFIDLEKVFDIVSHDILLEKLNHYGIRGLQMIGSGPI